GVTDPFIFLQLSTVERVVKEGSFSNPAAADPLYTPAFTSIMAILGLALGIPVWYLQFLPIHGVVLPLVYYVMCKRLTQSFWLAAFAITLYFNRVIYDAYLAAKRFTAVDSPSEFLAKYFSGLIPRGNNPYQYVVSDIWFNVSSIALIGALCAISVALLLYD